MKRKGRRPRNELSTLNIGMPSKEIAKENRATRRAYLMMKRNKQHLQNLHTKNDITNKTHTIDVEKSVMPSKEAAKESGAIQRPLIIGKKRNQQGLKLETKKDITSISKFGQPDPFAPSDSLMPTSQQSNSSKKRKPLLDYEIDTTSNRSIPYNIRTSDQQRKVYARLRRQDRILTLRQKLQRTGTKLRRSVINVSSGSNVKKQRRTIRAEDKYSVEASYYGPAEFKCKYCQAMFWAQEGDKKNSKKHYPLYRLCCKDGKIQLPRRKDPPEPLNSLLQGNKDPASTKFLDNIRAYNSMFAMTSMGAKVDTSINKNGSVYTYRISGQNYHRVGSLLPGDGQNPIFLQLYVHDTENESHNRLSVVEKLILMLNAHNEVVKIFRSVRDWYKENTTKNFTLKLIKNRSNRRGQYAPPSSSEIAMLIVGDITSTNVERDLIIQSSDGGLKRISDLHPLFMALQYPLLFPHGEDGFHTEILYARNSGHRRTKRKYLTAREYYSYVLQQRNDEGQTLQWGGRLYQQYIVDSYTQIEQQRLRWLKNNQGNLRTDLYRNVYDALRRGDSDSTQIGMRTILPSSFTGSPRYMMQNYQDAMSICRVYGNPDYFITFTANPNWKEIGDFLDESGCQKPENRPDIESRVFRLKLNEMIRDIIDNEIFGKVEAVIYTIEFQKRGLPHAHIIFWVESESKLHSTEQVDSVISAELPDPAIDPVGYEVVSQCMMHGPCGIANPNSPCMIDGICSKKIPKAYANQTTVDENGYCVYRRRDMGIFTEKNGIKLDNRHVAAYNRYLLVKYQSHINVEACNKSKAIKYLFKYVTKGPDRTTAVIVNSTNADKGSTRVASNDSDEIKTFLDCRYISACEAIWRIYEFPIHFRRPAVERLCYHLDAEQMLFFHDNEPLPKVLHSEKSSKTMFTEWMEMNKVDEEARALTYVEFPTKYVWSAGTFTWRRRKSKKSIGRLTFAHPSSGERYYLRLLLNIVKGPTCYEDIRKFEGVIYPTMKMACYICGILEDDGEWNEAIEEAYHWASGQKMRDLFLTILLFCDVSNIKTFWEINWSKLSEDILHTRRKILRLPKLTLTEDELKNLTLAELQKILLRNGRSLEDIDGMPLPDQNLLDQLKNRLILEEQNYDIQQLQKEHETLKNSLNEDQLNVYEKVISSVQSKCSKVFFLYGFGGTGKTFLYKAIINRLRSDSKIVLAVASSGIAALLLPGGRTAHSRFKIPLNVKEDSTCTIKQGTQLAELIRKSSLIIWDEAPMDAKHAFEAVDKTLKDILRGTESYDSDKPFGGKIVLLGGDFRQILPVIPGGSRGDIVNASLNSSYLWNDCEICVLSKNMRLHNSNPDGTMEKNQLEEFSQWILRIGDGKENAKMRGDADEAGWIKIPEELILESIDEPIKDIFQWTYPDFLTRKFDVSYLTGRAILTPKNGTVDEINTFIMEFVDADEKEYLSYDTIDKSGESTADQEMLYPIEFLNSVTLPGMPNHSLLLKKGVPIMLLRNVNPSKGMCNGTRLIITQLGRRVIEASIISGSNIGDKVLIPRITLTSSEVKLPFVMKRRQFPVRICYAMTINKSQGQTLENVGLYLPHPVFSHGQLYVALSRVKSPNGLKILCIENDSEFKGWTKNIVYREVFNTLGNL